ncbi:MAG: VWA domain-containing protein [bacterium]
MTMYLGSPYYLLLFLPLGVAVWFVTRRRIRQALLFSAFQRLPTNRATWRTRLQPIAPLLILASLALLVIALSRPQTLFSRTLRKSDAIAIQMVVDCSGSMQALDFATPDKQRTRLDVVKETFGKFVEQRPGDLIGLITFGGFASSRVPLTLDHEALLHSLQGVETAREQFSKDGQLLNQEEMLTAIGDALATGCTRLEDAGVKSRIMVLLSDGESNTGIIKPDEAAKAAKAMGIKIYSIGIGTTGRAPFLGRDMFGRQAIGYAEVKLDEDQLRSIATATQGKYFNVTDAKGLAQTMDTISKLEKTTINTELFNKYDEHFLIFLIPGLVLLIVGAVLNAWLGKNIL